MYHSKLHILSSCESKSLALTPPSSPVRPWSNWWLWGLRCFGFQTWSKQSSRPTKRWHRLVEIISLGLASQVTQKASQVKRLDPWSHIYIYQNNLLIFSWANDSTSFQTNFFRIRFKSFILNLSLCDQLQDSVRDEMWLELNMNQLNDSYSEE